MPYGTPPNTQLKYHNQLEHPHSHTINEEVPTSRTPANTRQKTTWRAGSEAVFTLDPTLIVLDPDS